MIAFQDIIYLVEADFQQVNQALLHALGSEVPLIEQIAHRLIQGGGKRLRPLIVLLSAKAAGYTGAAHAEAAAIIELIHTATLLHDDVVDHSSLRRGQPTANVVWGNAHSVLVGDFLYSKSFQMMTALPAALDIMQVLSQATSVIAEGEMRQLLQQHNPDLTEADYFQIILAKTAKLFEVSGQFGGLLAAQSAEVIAALGVYGLELGMAFQLMDDLLDYASTDTCLGKNIGDDLADGKATLPIIYAMQQSNPEKRSFLYQTLKEGKRENFDRVKDCIIETNAMAYTREKAQQASARACAALDILPDSPYRNGLIALAAFALARDH